MRSFYYRSYTYHHRIMVSESEIANISPTAFGYFELVLTSGFVVKVLHGMPDHVEYDQPEPLNDTRHWFDRYSQQPEGYYP